MSEKNPYKYNGDTLVINEETNSNATKSVYIESYGCAMNFSDTEIVASILSEKGVLVDLKGIFRNKIQKLNYWTL